MVKRNKEQRCEICMLPRICNTSYCGQFRFAIVFCSSHNNIYMSFSVESFLNHKIFHASTKIIISVDMYASKTFLFTQKVILLQLYKCGVRY